MSLIRKILAEFDRKAKLKRKLDSINLCKHRRERPFVWDGQTMCIDCCKHEYKDFWVTDEGDTTCMLCWVCWPYIPEYGRKVKVKKPDNPKIRVFDENGKSRRVKYHPEPQAEGRRPKVVKRAKRAS